MLFFLFLFLNGEDMCREAYNYGFESTVHTYECPCAEQDHRCIRLLLVQRPFFFFLQLVYNPLGSQARQVSASPVDYFSTLAELVNNKQSAIKSSYFVSTLLTLIRTTG